MLASTVQFSNNDRQPLLINPANTEQTQHREQPADAETEMARERNTLNNTEVSHRPSSQDPTAYLQPLTHHPTRSNSPHRRDGPQQLSKETVAIASYWTLCDQ